MDGKRPIDRLRESAGGFEINPPDDRSEIVDFVTVGDSALYVVKRGGVYRVMLADEIDPKRTNPKVPNAYQRVLPVGADDQYVVRLLLGSKRLLNDAYLGESLDCARGLEISLEVVTQVVTMREIAQQLANTIKTSGEHDAASNARGAVGLPSVGNLLPQVTAYFRHAHDALQAVLDLIKLFHGQRALGGRGKDRKKRPKNERHRDPFQAATEFARQEYGEASPLAKLLSEVLPFAGFVWKTRNNIEHPQQNERVVVSDFALAPSTNLIEQPSIKMISVTHPQPPVSVVEITGLYVEETASVFEVLLAVLCDQRVQADGHPFKTRVIELADTHPRRQHGRFNYEIQFPDGSWGLGL